RDQGGLMELIAYGGQTAALAPSPPAERPTGPLTRTTPEVTVLGTVHSATVGTEVLPLIRPGNMLVALTDAQVRAGSDQVPLENDGIATRTSPWMVDRRQPPKP